MISICSIVFYIPQNIIIVSQLQLQPSTLNTWQGKIESVLLLEQIDDATEQRKSRKPRKRPARAGKASETFEISPFHAHNINAHITDPLHIAPRLLLRPQRKEQGKIKSASSLQF